MSRQTDIENGLLLELARHLENDGSRIRQGQIGARFAPPLSHGTAKLGLDHLVSLGLAEANFDNPSDAGWKITRAGRLLIDEHWTKTEMSSGAILWEKNPDSPSSLDQIVRSVTSPEAIDTVASDSAFEHPKVPDQSTGVTINNFANGGTASISPSSTQKDINNRGVWFGVLVAIVIGALTISIMKGWL